LTSLRFDTHPSWYAVYKEHHNPLASPGLGIVASPFPKLFAIKKKKLVTYFLFCANSVNELNVGKRKTAEYRSLVNKQV